MEKLQGPINPCLFQEELSNNVGCLDQQQENGALSLTGMSYGQFLNNLEDPYNLPSLEDNKMPFLQMLQGIDSQHQQHQLDMSFLPLFQEPNFQLLLKLQHQKLLMKPLDLDHNQNISCYNELESCVTTTTTTTNNNNNDMGLQSPVKAHEQEEFGPEAQIEKASVGNGRSKKSTNTAQSGDRQRRKRKRATRVSKNKEEVETQRMTHIAVERNRRRQMNDHLNALRSLMPSSYIQRGDQASIIGGAIDFVKELEQLLQSLQAQKRMKQSDENGDVSASSSTSSSSNLLGNMFMAPPSSSSPSSPLQFRYPHSHTEGNGNSTEGGKGNNEEFCAETRSALADIEVVVIQNHVNLKIQCQRRPGQLLQAIVALEQLRLSVLHLNITSLHSLVHYSFNLKIEEDCKLGSAEEVASAVHQIFSLINIS